MRPKTGLFRLIHLCLATLFLSVLTLLPLHKESPKVLSAVTPPIVQISSKGQQAPIISARGIMIADPVSGDILYTQGSNERFYPASTTKIATALVALSAFQEDQVLTVGEGYKAAGNKVKFYENEQLTVKSLLYGLLVPSGNDAAMILAESYPDGGYPGFVTKMNSLVHELGLTDTHFTNPSGVNNPDHYTTVRDLTLLAINAIRHPLIREIVGTKSHTISDVTGTFKHDLESTNLLLDLEGVKGLKTGWTPESGECLVTYVVRNDLPLIITVLDSKDRFTDSKILIDWAYQNFSNK